jgi:hypothetical protein
VINNQNVKNKKYFFFKKQYKNKNNNNKQIKCKMIKISHIRTIFHGKNEYLASKKHFQRVTEEIENIIFLLEMIFFLKKS